MERKGQRKKGKVRVQKRKTEEKDRERHRKTEKDRERHRKTQKDTERQTEKDRQGTLTQKQIDDHRIEKNKSSKHTEEYSIET